MRDREAAPRLRWTPGLGGKITGLRFGERGFGELGFGEHVFAEHSREWLAPPVRPLAVPSPGQDWGELDCSGWDECLPNIAAAPELGLADHGDVWRHPWDPTPGSVSEVSVSGTVTPPGRTYRFGRDITAEDGALRIEYRLRNDGALPLHWAWAQHMLLAADERTRIVASSPMNLRLDAAFRDGRRDDAVFDDTAFEFPAGISELRGVIGCAAKLWLEPPLPAVVAVVHGGAREDVGDWLAWRVADSPFPHLGLWLNLGGWGGVPLRHVAVEPAFGAHDKPSDAYADLDPLAPGAERTWRVLIEAGSGQAALDTLLGASIHV
jgi:hypothetical protein